jgi:adenylate cyclase
VNWFSRWTNNKLNPSVSAVQVSLNADVLESATATPEQKAEAIKFFEQFKDGIVLIGPVDDTLKDLSPTPFDANPVPEVGVYGNLLKTFFSGEYIRHPPAWVNPLLQFGLTALVGVLAMYNRRGATMAKLGAVLVLVGYIYGVLEVFAEWNLVLPLIVPAGSAFTTAFVGAVVRLIDEEKQKKRIKGMFGTYLAPEVVNDMVESGKEPQLGGHNVVITCFFSDVQGFSTFSEVMTPDRLTNLMNEYLTAMTDILQAERGSLDKYIGDAIVAMYGAPVDLKDHALRACVAACRMQQRLGELRQKWISEGDKWPERVHKMRMRIGLNTGETIVGNMGSANRFNYTMMGDTVNLAARCESGAKQFGVYAMCTEETKKAAEAQGGGMVFRRLNKIVVKGKTQPVEVHEIVGLRAEATPETLRCVELFEQALELYFAQKWDEAKALFAEAEKLEPLKPGRDPGVAHNPSELMQEWCDEMKVDPPGADWNGVLEMKEK